MFGFCAKNKIFFFFFLLLLLLKSLQNPQRLTCWTLFVVVGLAGRRTEHAVHHAEGVLSCQLLLQLLFHLRIVVQVLVAGDAVRARLVQQELVGDAAHLARPRLDEAEVDQNLFGVHAVTQHQLVVAAHRITDQIRSDQIR